VLGPLRCAMNGRTLGLQLPERSRVEEFKINRKDSTHLGGSLNGILANQAKKLTEIQKVVNKSTFFSFFIFFRKAISKSEQKVHYVEV